MLLHSLLNLCMHRIGKSSMTQNLECQQLLDVQYVREWVCVRVSSPSARLNAHARAQIRGFDLWECLTCEPFREGC